MNFHNVLRQLSDSETPDRIAEAHECSDAVKNCLAALQARELEALQARWGLSGESVDSVAGRHGVHIETARNWARAARKKLSHQLAGMSYFSDD